MSAHIKVKAANKGVSWLPGMHQLEYPCLTQPLSESSLWKMHVALVKPSVDIREWQLGPWVNYAPWSWRSARGIPMGISMPATRYRSAKEVTHSVQNTLLNSIQPRIWSWLPPWGTYFSFRSTTTWNATHPSRLHSSATFSTELFSPYTDDTSPAPLL